jgi:hypothetical protein
MPHLVYSGEHTTICKDIDMLSKFALLVTAEEPLTLKAEAGIPRKQPVGSESSDCSKVW